MCPAVDPAIDGRMHMFRLVVLVLAWLAWSGHYTYSLEDPLIAVFGVLSCACVWWLSRRMDDSHIYGGKPSLGIKTFPYLGWLLVEIVKANLAVARILIDPRMPISPRIIRVRGSQHSEDARVLYANSITLTPGTITLDVRRDQFYIHAIDEAAAVGVQEGEMDRRVTALERRT